MLIYSNLITHRSEFSDGVIMTIMINDGSGVVRLYWFNDDSKSLYLEGLHISEDKRNLGYGKLLLNYCINYAKTNNFNKLYLWCIKNEWVYSWYKRCGFVDDSIYDNVPNSIWMIKNII